MSAAAKSVIGHLYACQQTMFHPSACDGVAQSNGSGGGLARLDQQVMMRRVNWLTSIREWQASAHLGVESAWDGLLPPVDGQQ